MTDQLQAAAKAGDIKALEALMNKAFESKGLTVRVTNSGTLLKVVVRGKEAPDRSLQSSIESGLKSVSPKGFERFVVTARSTGKADAWSFQGSFKRDDDPQSSTENELNNHGNTKSWYQSSWLIISSLILFPPVGIPLTWMSRWSTFLKIGASAISGFWFLLLLVASSPSDQQTTTAQEETQNSAAELVTEPESVTPEIDRSFADAVNAAMTASQAAQTASNADEWQSVADLWSRVIELMKAVPETNKDYQTARQKATEYQANLEYAKQQNTLLTPTLNLNKADLSSYFSQPDLGFSFESVPLTDGTPRLLGTTSNNLATIELYGSTNLVTEATISTFIGEGVPSALLAKINLAFLNKIVSGYDWDATLGKEINELFETKSESARRISAGDKIVSAKLNEISGTSVYMLLITVKPSN